MAGGRHTLSAAARTRRRDRTHRKGQLWLLLMCVILLGALISLFTVRGLRITDLRRQLSSAIVGRSEALVVRADLESQLARQDDLDAIEDAAREKLGWVRPGEERVLFVDQHGNTASGGE